ncbi:MAG: hypothetical protein COA99_11445 [Moraxellaceae bacterium]|nr:MAG: hypothetical protein COA99_11445 [Moraxellaceae bacterium]
MRKLVLVTTWLIPLFCLLWMTQANAADRPNLLIMGEDADDNSIPRNHDAFTRVLNALSNQLHEGGFDVFDETAVTLDNFVQGRVRRTDAELIDIAKSISRPPIDVVILFSIYSIAYKTDYTTKVHARIQGRLLNVQTGQRLGNVEIDYPGGWNTQPNCETDCLLSSVGDHAKIIANDVGAILAAKLSWLVHTPETMPTPGVMAYNLIFDDFTQQEVMEFEEYLVIFSGYESHRITYGGATRTEYWYKSDISNAKLSRNLNKLLERLHINGLVQVAGNTYTVKKIGLRANAPKLDPRDW